jgi:LemA protein
LIGNLIDVVKGAAEYERTILTEVIEARAKATSTTIDASNITPENMAQFQQAQAGLSGALSKLLVSVERYPELKSNENFLKLQDELASTENSVRTSRNRFNTAANNYNKAIKTFPNNMFAGMFGFKDMQRFKADPGADKKVDTSGLRPDKK